MVSCEENYGIDTLRLKVTLVGPPGLDRVDFMMVSILDDSLDRLANAAEAGPSLEEFLDQIWGPLRFLPGSGPDHARADTDARTFRHTRGLATGVSTTCLMEQTKPPPWLNWNGTRWRENVGTVLFLSITMHHDGHGTWKLPAELDIGGVLLRQGPARVVLPMRP